MSFATASTATAATPPSGADEPLAVVNAGGGSFTETSDGYRLTLEDVTRRAVWFSDRPQRSTGSYSFAELDEVFFADDEPPNAALEVLTGRASATVVIVEVSDPRYQPRKERLVLDARVLAVDELHTAALGDHAERATSDVPARFGPAALFLDAGCSTSGGTITALNGVTCDQALEVVSAFSGHTCAEPIAVGEDTWVCQIITAGGSGGVKPFNSLSTSVKSFTFVVG